MPSSRLSGDRSRGDRHRNGSRLWSPRENGLPRSPYPGGPKAVGDRAILMPGLQSMVRPQARSMQLFWNPTPIPPPQYLNSGWTTTKLQRGAEFETSTRRTDTCPHLENPLERCGGGSVSFDDWDWSIRPFIAKQWIDSPGSPSISLRPRGPLSRSSPRTDSSSSAR